MINTTRRAALMGTGALALTAAIGAPARLRAEGKTLKIGQLGVMSGPEASWDLVNKYSALATTEMWNEKGSVEIGGEL